MVLTRELSVAAAGQNSVSLTSTLSEFKFILPCDIILLSLDLRCVPDFRTALGSLLIPFVNFLPTYPSHILHYSRT